MKQFAIIIPAYKPGETCRKLIDDIIKANFQSIILIDDGSGKEFEPIFHAFSLIPQVTLLRHAVNQGKGRALKTAFHYILNNSLPHKAVITVDADGQHLVSDMVKVAKQMSRKTNAIVLGNRDFSEKGVPFRSFFGNRCTRLLFRLSTGTVLTDTQTGLRGIPTKHLPQLLGVTGERFEYEMNMLAALKPKNIPIEEVAIQTVYLGENKSSHFRPLRDSFHIYKVFLFYALSGAASFAIDIGLYALFIKLWREDAPELFIVIATIAARFLSALFNYYINRNKVFKQGSRNSFIRYYLLAASIMLISAGSVHFLYAEWLGRGEIVLKVIVDAILFIFGFIIQRAWVFRKE
ncbi:dolichol-phosphate mannosyltransferase [Psychrobacillus sp. OK028]|uniref:bifunctional glycosyltransferase family 2/GtrA family protein n=1 Tax=Psychrobacillus sp. OK028 TaxID=1884359 RepID=UPI00088EF838|nr:bifunctional glycosyltransferase family 2/GtrA family protein [Psychrobacillus sp. OK028]SDO21684.1 dolichol-phosphate mannosyltransferase [Psychrobacillus sp. OK028]